MKRSLVRVQAHPPSNYILYFFMQVLTYPPIKTTLQDHGDRKFLLSVYPLLPGFGYTFGNSLRRILLTSIPGFAVTKVRVNDLTHEYQAIEGVKEDALDVLLNLKSLRVRINTDSETVTVAFKTKLGGEVTGASFDTNAEVEILNPEAYICSVTKGVELSIELEVSRGYGYVSYEKRDLRGNTDPTALLIDALYTPVKNVALEVNQTRVGDQTNYDKIDISFETDGTLTGQEIVEHAVQLMVNISNNIHSAFGASSDIKQLEKVQQEGSIELAPKITNILKKNGITTNEELKSRLAEVQDLPGLGDKALEQIQEYINTL